MENFITGYPGHEHEVRAALKKVLGEDKYEFFFDKVSGNDLAFVVCSEGSQRPSAESVSLHGGTVG
jgi:hypothetical protein